MQALYSLSKADFIIILLCNFPDFQKGHPCFISAQKMCAILNGLLIDNLIVFKSILFMPVSLEFVEALQSVSKDQPCDVIKMREIRGEVGKETPKKDMDNPLFL